MDTKSFNESPACGIINRKYHSPRLLGLGWRKSLASYFWLVTQLCWIVESGSAPAGNTKQHLSQESGSLLLFSIWQAEVGI